MGSSNSVCCSRRAVKQEQLTCVHVYMSDKYAITSKECDGWLVVKTSRPRNGVYVKTSYIRFNLAFCEVYVKDSFIGVVYPKPDSYNISTDRWNCSFSYNDIETVRFSPGTGLRLGTFDKEVLGSKMYCEFSDIRDTMLAFKWASLFSSIKPGDWYYFDKFLGDNFGKRIDVVDID